MTAEEKVWLPAADAICERANARRMKRKHRQIMLVLYNCKKLADALNVIISNNSLQKWTYGCPNKVHNFKIWEIELKSIISIPNIHLKMTYPDWTM